MTKAAILHGALGDVAAITAASNNPRLGLDEIVLITSNEFAALATKHGSFKAVLPFPASPPIKTADLVIAQGVSAVVDLHNKSYLESEYLTWLRELSQVPVYLPENRKAFIGERPGIFAIPQREPYDAKHNVEYYLSRLGIRTQLFADDLRFINIHSSSQSVVSLAPMSRYEHKMWPAASWQELIRNLEMHKVPVQLVAASYEQEQVERLRGNLSCPIVLVSAINEYVNILGSSRAVVAVDNGLKHIACYAGTTVIALYGPSSPTTWGSLSSRELPIRTTDECSPCNNPFNCEKTVPTCMSMIAVESVFNEIMEAI